MSRRVTVDRFSLILSVDSVGRHVADKCKAFPSSVLVFAYVQSDAILGEHNSVPWFCEGTHDQISFEDTQSARETDQSSPFGAVFSVVCYLTSCLDW